MQQWAEAELRQFAPRARDEYIAALVDGWHEIDRAEINTPERLCCFLSQWSAETDGFTVLVEDMHYKTAKLLCKNWPDQFGEPTAANLANPMLLACLNNPERLGNKVYGGRNGNTDHGDGFRYRGRGFNQETWKENYRRHGQQLGVDLVEHPELLEQSLSISLRVAILEWTECKCNRYADRLNIRAIGNAINRGNAFASKEPLGAARRKAEFDRAWAIFGADQLPAISGLALGDVGVQVETVQKKLIELGYPVGKPDGIYGPSMARAVAGFKAHWAIEHPDDELEQGDLVDARTMAALSRAEPIKPSEERASATVADVAAAGSTTMASGGQIKKGAGALVGYGLLDAASSQGGIGQADVLNQLSALPAAQSALEPAIRSMSWILSNAKWVIIIGLGVWIYLHGASVVKGYVARYRAGHILWR